MRIVVDVINIKIAHQDLQIRHLTLSTARM